MNTADGAGLLAAILAEPGDDGLRLIYADYLEENDQRRGSRTSHAHFIRDQVGGCIGDVVVRGTEFFDYTGPGCAFPYRFYTTTEFDSVVLRRGFLHTIRCPLAAWLEHGKAIAAAHPVERWELSDRRPEEIQRRGFKDVTWYYDTMGEGDEHCLPHDVFDLLSGQAEDSCAERYHWKDYREKEAALDALSAALVALSRPKRTPAPETIPDVWRYG